MKLPRLVHFGKLRAQATRLVLFAAVVTASSAVMAAATPDPILEWIGIFNNTAISAGTNPLVTARSLALLSASMFDAVNGVNPRYQPLHVTPNAPPHASQRAAAIQAAYATMIRLYPTLIGSLTTQRDASIAALTERPGSIQAGMAWANRLPTASGRGARRMVSCRLLPRFSVCWVSLECRRQLEFGGLRPRSTRPAPDRSSPA